MAKNQTSLNAGHKKPGPGRPKGAANKTTALIREAISKEFERRNKGDWLKKLDDDQFISLLKHILPKPIEVAGLDGDPLIIEHIVAAISGLSEEMPDYAKEA